MSGPTMGQVGMYAGAGQASILGAVSAGSPDMMSTYLKSWQLLSGEIGISFIPAMARASQLIQSTARWIRDLDDGTKTNAANFAFWGTAIGLGAFGLSKVINAGLGAVEVFGKIRAAAMAATGAIGGMRNAGAQAGAWPAGMNPVANGPQAMGMGAWLRQNPAMVGGFAGAGLSAYGYMAQDGPMAQYARLAGNSLMLGSFLTPQNAGYGALARNSLYAAGAQIVLNRVFDPSEVRNVQRPDGFVQNENIERQIRDALSGTAYFTSLTNPGQPRFDAVQAIANRYGLSPQDFGISGSDALRGGGLGSRMDQDLINRIARNASYATFGRSETPEQTERRAAQLESQGDRRGAANLRLQSATSERDRLLWSTNFQPQQVPIESLKGMIQNEIIRSPQDQELMAQQMRALESLTRTIERLNSNLQQTAPQNAAIP